MNFPARLIKFWYPDALNLFIRSWVNLLNVLEEDLAVGLMIKLIFVPLFHDSTFIGRVLSLIFRSIRILAGLVAFAFATVIVLLIGLTWFLLPGLAFLSLLVAPIKLFSPVFYILILMGVALFLDSLSRNPPLEAAKIRSLTDLWQATKLKKNNLTWQNLLESPEVTSLLESLELTKDQVGFLRIEFSDNMIEEITKLAKFTQAKYLTEDYFWVGMISSIPGINQHLLKLNLTIDDFVKALSYLEHKRNKWRHIYLWDEDFAVKHLKGINRGWLGAPTPYLDSVSHDLTKEASRRVLPDFIGRGSVVSQIVSILSQVADRNILLVGPPGTGKSALVNYLAKLIVAGDAPDALATKRLVSLDITQLLSGVREVGELAEKVKAVFEEVRFVQEIIIFIDEVHNLGLGEVGDNFNLFGLLLPYLESGDFQFIAATEEGNYARIIEKRGDFARIFHKVELPPASTDETEEIIKDRSIDLARYQKIHLSYLAIKELVQLSSKLIHDRVLPDSALFMLQEAETHQKDGKISSQVVKELFEARSKVPVLDLNEQQKQLLLNLEAFIHEKLIDQEEAVKAVADSLRRSATALRENERPIGSFLFVGPTGVGKTELAKILARVYFKDEQAFVRFDMSEYQTEEAVNRLIGTLENPGELTEAVKNRPYSLLLLDEFEKANPAILNLFLQVLEDGRLTDASGHTSDFTNTIIIATSNVASVVIADGLKNGLSLKDLDKEVKDELLRVFKPELVNRFDGVVTFKTLSENDLKRIVDLKLKALADKMRQEGYDLGFSPGLLTALVKKGFDPILGARPLRRLIQDTLEANLSKMILENKLVKGESYIADASIVTG
ncbi:ATP-dependent Clp protease ATP-binding subunit [Candidatus Daviesbacteria bacterium]|nr:ATP-dependent Clp protease ATP-binding subunit [Candidatus Daviesbacteria bacterium]